MNTATGQRDARGFTLAEAMLAAVILTLAVTAMTMPFTAAAANEAVETRRTLASALAQELMEEILTKPFADPQGGMGVGPEVGESPRGGFDNVDDYGGYSEPAGEIVGATGQVVSDPVSQEFSRDTEAVYVYVSGQDTNDPPTFIRVTVTVKYRDSTVARLTRLVYSMQ